MQCNLPEVTCLIWKLDRLQLCQLNCLTSTLLSVYCVLLASNRKSLSICWAIKQNESELEQINIFSFLLYVILHSKSYILLKTSLKLDMSIQSYDLLKGCQNSTRKENKRTYFLCLALSPNQYFRLICLIIPQLWHCGKAQVLDGYLT